MKIKVLFGFTSAALLAGLLILAALPALAQSAADANKLEPAAVHAGQVDAGPGYPRTTPPSLDQLRGNPDIIIVDDVNFPVANTTDGSSINWVTGDTCDCDTTPGYHFNPWSSGGNLSFWWWSGTDSRAGVSTDGTTYAVLGEGDTVGPDSTFISAGFPAGTVNWRQADNVDGYLGFRFDNGGTVNYGYVRLTTTGTTGFPATIVSYAYNQAGDPITIAGAGPQDPEIEVSPASFAFTVDAGDTDTETLEIANIGGESLDWSIELEPGLGLREHDPLLDEALDFPEFTVISPANGGEAVVFDVAAGVLTNGIVVGFSFEGTVSGVTGNGDWASDMCMQIEGPDGSSYTVGGISASVANCNINPWDFQGGGSSEDGTYSSEHDNVWPFPPGAADEGDWTFTFIHGWDSTSANPMTWTDVSVTLHKIVEPEPCDSPAAVSWLSVDPASGSAVPGTPSLVDVTVDSDGLAVGSYNANLCITSNDTAGNELVVVPVELIVEEGAAPEIEVTPTSLFGSASACDATDLSLDIANIGTAELTWNIDEAPAASPRAHFPSRAYVPTVRSDATADLGAEPLAAEWLAKMADDASAAGAWHWGERGLVDPVPAYSTSGFSRSDYVSMDALVPGTLTSIIDPGPSTVFAQTFIDDDFSQHFFIATGGGALPQGAYGFVDTATGAVNQLGILSGVPATGTWVSAAWDPVSGTVYGLIVPAGGDNRLFEIDVDTGIGTLVGTVSGIDAGGIVIGIAINSSGQMYGLEIIADVLVAIDKTDASGAVIGPVGVNANFAQDMDFDRSTDTLYWASYLGGGNSNIRIIDTSTGGTTLVGPIQDGAELLSFSVAVAGGSGCMSPSDVPWMSLDIDNGSVQPGDPAQTVEVTLDPNGLFSGTYQALLCINSNDPVTPLVEVPVEFEVQTSCVTDGIFWDRFEE